MSLFDNGFVRCLCGTTCAICWIAIGIWAFFFLGILALLFKLGKQGNIGHFSLSDAENARNIFWAWFIYVFLTIFCAFNFWYRSKYPFPPKEDEEAIKKKNQFSAIGATTMNTNMSLIEGK